MNTDKFLYFDGAMGTMITSKIGNTGEINEVLNITSPDVIREIHREYYLAGSNILKTNTFGANRLKMEQTGYSVEDIITAAVENAREACDGKCLIAMDIGPTGKMLEPLGDLSFDEACDIFEEMALCGKKANADLILIETMSDLYELKAAVLGAKKSGLPIYATVTVDKSGRLLTGGDIKGVISMLTGLGVSAVGLNCGLSCSQVKELLTNLTEYSSIPIIINPNAGLPQTDENNNITYDLTSDDFASQMAEIAKSGGNILGGCCGTTPEYIEKLIKATKDLTPQNLKESDCKIPCSYRMSAEYDGSPIIIANIGEQPMKDAQDGDFYTFVDEGIDFQSSGANIIYMGACDDPEIYENAVKTIQGSVTLPLMLDGQNLKSLEGALRVYNGRPLVYNPCKEAEEIIEYYGGIICDDITVASNKDEIKDTKYILCNMTASEIEEL